jgi:predicted RNase H-like HicB family nuclease
MARDPWTNPDPQPGDFDADLAAIDPRHVETHAGVPHAKLAIVTGSEPPYEVEVVLTPQEGGGYHVYAPELPGLHTQGDTHDEATANAEEALALHLEDIDERKP